VDSAWEQYKLEARKLLEKAADSHLSSARGVGRTELEVIFAINKYLLFPNTRYSK
jgi:hypothetical protein